MKVKVKAIHLDIGAECTEFGTIEMDKSEVDQYADDKAKTFKTGTLQILVDNKHYAYYQNIVGWGDI